MKPLHLLLIVKNSPGNFERENKGFGYFSYAVPEFTWDYESPGKHARIDLRAAKRRGYNAVLHLDGGCWGNYVRRDIPAIYYSVDSTIRPEHYAPRLAQAGKADLVLVDHDRLERFAATGRKVRRWLYCVNDRLFYPREKVTDVAYHCNSSGVIDSDRAKLREELTRFTANRGYSFRRERLSVAEYAASLGSARVVVNLPQVPINRPHRVYDAMASGAALVTGTLPKVSGENLRRDYEYVDFATHERCCEAVDGMLFSGAWEPVAQRGYDWVMAGHTWAHRAAELRAMLHKELGL